MKAGADTAFDSDKPWIAAVVKGKLLVGGNSVEVTLLPGEFCLVPADVKSASLSAEGDTVFLLSMAE
jgi:mannose-6-phosphate isomerase class I